MKPRQKNIFKASLQLCAALLGTILSFIQVVIASVLGSKHIDDDEPAEFFARDSEGNMVTYKSDGEYRIIGK